MLITRNEDQENLYRTSKNGQYPGASRDAAPWTSAMAEFNLIVQIGLTPKSFEGTLMTINREEVVKNLITWTIHA